MAKSHNRTWFNLAFAAIFMANSPMIAMAKTGTPGPDYFAGVYERVGRDAAGALQNDLVTITPKGKNVMIAACTGAPLNLGFGPAFEIVNIMTGDLAGDAVQCLFHNNGYNYPILTCRSEGGAAFTLWPTTTKSMTC